MEQTAKGKSYTQRLLHNIPDILYGSLKVSHLACFEKIFLPPYSCGSTDGNVSPFIEWNFSVIKWVAQRMNPNGFEDPLDFHLVPPAGQMYYLSFELYSHHLRV